MSAASASRCSATRRCPMEPRGLLAEWDAEQRRLTVSGAAKSPVPQHAACWRSMMGLRRTIRPHGGIRRGRRLWRARRILSGGFSDPVRGALTGRPVKWIEDRRENLLATNHARDAECELEIACDARRNNPRLARHAPSPTSAPICAPSARPPRATSRR